MKNNMSRNKRMNLIKTLRQRTRQSSMLPRSLQTAKDKHMMFALKKTASLFRMFALTVCLFPVLLMSAAAQDNAADDYNIETIEVPGVDFLALTASSDFQEYAGYTRDADGKEVAFTLIDGVFTTYDVPGSQKTHFYAFGNDGRAAGHYMDSEGRYHGVILENGELRQYDFPNSVQTEIYGISDATGVLTGNFKDADGVRRGFTGDEIVEFPGATATFAKFANSSGGIVGSYVDAEGVYHAYARTPDGEFVSATLLLPTDAPLEYFHVHSINDANVYVVRAKSVGDMPSTYVGAIWKNAQEFKVPDSVSTEGWNINQDGSVVGYYDLADGSRHGFVATPIDQDDEPTVPTLSELHYVFETIDVPGVEFLELTASSDFNDYAGNTRNADGKEVGFTLIDGVFKTYDFPGSQKTQFYALANAGVAAGRYMDSEGRYHGVVLLNGQLRQFDIPGSVETEIYGISDATGVLTGNFTDAAGVRRGFSGEIIIEVPGASATFADFVNSAGRIVGSYIDADGVYRPYTWRDGEFTLFDVPQAEMFEYYFMHGINDAAALVTRSKRVGDTPRTHVGSFRHGLKELKVPGSVSTEGWNINQDHSIVGNYKSADGRTHGFIARMASEDESAHFGNVYTVTLPKGLNMISMPLKPSTPMNAKALAGLVGSTTVITLDTAKQRFVGWTPDAPDDGFAIEGGKGYIVNVPTTRRFAFVGAPWADPVDTAPGAPPLTAETLNEAWAFVVSGHLEGRPAQDGYISTTDRETSSSLMSMNSNTTATHIPQLYSMRALSMAAPFPWSTISSPLPSSIRSIQAILTPDGQSERTYAILMAMCSIQPRDALTSTAMPAMGTWRSSDAPAACWPSKPMTGITTTCLFPGHPAPPKTSGLPPYSATLTCTTFSR